MHITCMTRFCISTCNHTNLVGIVMFHCSRLDGNNVNNMWHFVTCCQHDGCDITSTCLFVTSQHATKTDYKIHHLVVLGNMFFIMSWHKTTHYMLQTQLIQSQDLCVTHVGQKLATNNMLSWHVTTCGKQFPLSIPRLPQNSRILFLAIDSGYSKYSLKYSTSLSLWSSAS